MLCNCDMILCTYLLCPDRNRKRKLKISAAPTKAKSRKPAYSQALIQNKIDRQRFRSTESGRQTIRRLVDSVWSGDGEGGREDFQGIEIIQIQQQQSGHRWTTGEPRRRDSALVSKLMPCAWLSSGALEVRI